MMNPYLNFPGTTETAFVFYKSVLGGEFTMLQRFKDTPQASQLSSDEQEKIMHIALLLGKNGGVLMGTDTLASMGQKLTMGNNFSLSLHAESKEEADMFFTGLVAGGTVVMPLQDTFWGAYFGILTDQFGLQWMVNYDYPKQ